MFHNEILEETTAQLRFSHSNLHACIGGHTQLVQYLLVKYNVQHFDLRSAINAASYYGRTEVVQLFLQVFHYETFDMDSVIYHAGNSGNIGLVEWLLGVYDHEIFNIESGFLEDVKRSRRVSKLKSCSTCDTCRVTLVTNPVLSFSKVIIRQIQCVSE
jgi:hypothetical protein